MNPEYRSRTAGDIPYGTARDTGLATRAIHAGYRPDPATGAVNVPIYASSTFAQDGVGGLRGGFEYSRIFQPDPHRVGGLARSAGGGGVRAGVQLWGMAATDCALRALLRPGDHVVIPNDAYGGTFRLIDKVLTLWGVTYTAVPQSHHDAVRDAVTGDTKLIWVEDADESDADDRRHRLDRRAGPRAVGQGVGGQHFCVARLAAPLTLGADIVLHSTTKYIGGHSDVVGGALLTNDEHTDVAFGFLQNGAGAVPGPFDAYLTLRGLKTLVIRMQRHTENATRAGRIPRRASRGQRHAVSGVARPSGT